MAKQEEMLGVKFDNNKLEASSVIVYFLLL